MPVSALSFGAAGDDHGNSARCPIGAGSPPTVLLSRILHLQLLAQGLIIFIFEGNSPAFASTAPSPMPFLRHANPYMLHPVHRLLQQSAQLFDPQFGKGIGFNKAYNLWAAFFQTELIHGKLMLIIFVERHDHRTVAAETLDEPNPIIGLPFPESSFRPSSTST